MRILEVCHYAGSPAHGMSLRPYHMAREWVRRGHEVTLVAADHAHVRSRNPEIQGDRQWETLDGIRYLWLRTPPYAGNGARRALNIFTFVLRLRLMARELARDLEPDVVIASSTYPLDIVPALAIARAARARLIFEVHDLWPLSPIELGGMSRAHPFILLMQWAEYQACTMADQVVSLLPLAKDHLVAHGMAPDKFAHIPNGVVLEDWADGGPGLPEEHRAVLEAWRAAGCLIVGYTGAHGLANALDVLLDAAKRMGDSKVRWLLVGWGPERERLMARVADEGIPNVTFLPPVGKRQMPALLRAMDILYIGMRRIPIYRFGMSPNKLIDYLMAGRPVIQGVEAGNDITLEAGCGLSIAPEDPEAVCRAVRELAALGPEGRAALGARGRAHALAHHDYSQLAERFLAIMGTGLRPRR